MTIPLSVASLCCTHLCAAVWNYVCMHAFANTHVDTHTHICITFIVIVTICTCQNIPICIDSSFSRANTGLYKMLMQHSGACQWMQALLHNTICYISLVSKTPGMSSSRQTNMKDRNKYYKTASSITLYAFLNNPTTTKSGIITWQYVDSQVVAAHASEATKVC